MKSSLCDTFWTPIKEYKEHQEKKQLLDSKPQYVIAESHEFVKEMVKALKKMGIHVYKDPTNESTTPSLILSNKRMNTSEIKKFAKSQWA